MTETTDKGYYKAALDFARDCDGDPATVEVTASIDDYGTDIELLVTAWNSTAVAYLTPEQTRSLAAALTKAIDQATAQ